MLSNALNALFDALPAPVKRGEVLKNYTTIKCGGPAAALLEVTDAQQAAAALKAARKAGIPVLLLGNGSNMLVDDRGFDGLVIHFGPGFSGVSNDGARIVAEAGASLMTVARAAADRGFSGLEFAVGIPASVGGATLMNAGAYGGEMARVVTRVDCLTPEGDPLSLSAEELDYGYRHSRMMDRGLTVLRVHMALLEDDSADIWKRVSENQALRRLKQPLTYPSAGSFFKRPEGYFAGALIEQAGLKGTAVGGAQVSQLHAGFLINTGGATADDFFRLVKLVQERVMATSGVTLEPEVRLVRPQST